jgi:hypothetical protein
VYDAAKGQLTGRSGLLTSFTVDFLPADLFPKPNPGIPENVTVEADATIAFIKVFYTQAYADEILTVSATAAVDFIYVGVVNP